MSQDSSKVITRQWTIMQFLMDSQYVSTKDVEQYLETQGIVATQRTIQRDLNLLEKLFPLESRRDCMPYSWRWKKVEKSVKGLSLSQLLILRLVDEELKDILPENTQQELAPLFEKARWITSNRVYSDNERSLLDILTQDRRKHRGLVERTVIQELTSEIGKRAEKTYREIFNCEARELEQQLKTLTVILSSYQMPELAQILKNSK